MTLLTVCSRLHFSSTVYIMTVILLYIFILVSTDKMQKSWTNMNYISHSSYFGSVLYLAPLLKYMISLITDTYMVFGLYSI